MNEGRYYFSNCVSGLKGLFAFGNHQHGRWIEDQTGCGSVCDSAFGSFDMDIFSFRLKLNHDFEQIVDMDQLRGHSVWLGFLVTVGSDGEPDPEIVSL